MSADPPDLRHGDIVRIRGERWRIVGRLPHGSTTLVHAAGCDLANRAAAARFLLPFEPIDVIDACPAPRLVSPGRWRRVARRALAEACPSLTSLRAAAHANLTIIPFQLEPALSLLRGDGCRLLIADAVGLGKTVQAGLVIAETLHRRADARVLVITPAGLRDQWRTELRCRFSLDADILDAAGVSRLAVGLPHEVNPWTVPALAITSIDFVKRPEVLRALEELTWDVVVLDEAHNLTGRSDRATAATLLAGRARVLVLLTATPHSGDEAAFERLCRLGSLGAADPLVAFRRTHTDAGLAREGRTAFLRVRPTAAEAAMYDALANYAQRLWHQSTGGDWSASKLTASVLMRRACSSAGSLARSLERRLRYLAVNSAAGGGQVDLPLIDPADADDEPDAALRAPGLRDVADECACLERLLALARTAAGAESKMAALRRLLSRTGEPAVVFTEYRDTLERLAAALGDMDPALLHGGLTRRERSESVRRFTHGHARLLLATDAGSEGLNLHHRCRLVVNLEVPWTPLRLEQRAGRVDRIGQAKRVHALHLVAAGSCEEATLARLAQRIQRLRGALSLLTRLPDDRRVAQSVFGEEPLPERLAAVAALPAGVVSVDRRGEARDEASRIVRARALFRHSSTNDADGRPLMTYVRRHRRSAVPQCIWLFKVALTGADGRLVSESVVPVTADAAIPFIRSRASIRRVLDTHHAGLQSVLSRARAELTHEIRGDLAAPLGRWMARERELVAALIARDARLSAGLLQPGLFDRRRDRAAAAQARVREQALAQSSGRLADLISCADIRVDACDLVFAVVLE